MTVESEGGPATVVGGGIVVVVVAWVDEANPPDRVVVGVVFGEPAPHDPSVHMMAIADPRAAMVRPIRMRRGMVLSLVA
ncbi:MAG: hypothetical protein JST73_07710 [Actinobacteria bacterium]|nr:hypothetical protein [Actinomycetota bacterium]